MLVTVMADASHCPQTKAAGYGFWIASGRGKKGGGGAMKSLVSTSTLAEMQAVANALYIGLRCGLIQQQDRVLIQTDCEAAIFAFQALRNVNEEEKKVVKWLYAMLNKHELKMEIRHVKGHSSSRAPRYAANNCCDKRALKAMRKARDKIRIKVSRRF